MMSTKLRPPQGRHMSIACDPLISPGRFPDARYISLLFSMHILQRISSIAIQVFEDNVHFLLTLIDKQASIVVIYDK